MSDGTKIEWTEATWNPITGCSVLSPGCTNCYAMKLAGTRLQHHPSRAGLTRATKAGPVWTGEVRLNDQWLDQPLRWQRARMIFVCAHGDLFHESVPDTWIDRVFAVMALSTQHTFQVLTKRSARMREYVVRLGSEASEDRFSETIFELVGQYASWRWPLPNVWLGVSVEDQQRADERLPDLMSTPAAKRWVSAEPLLGHIHLGYIGWPNGTPARRTGWSALLGVRWQDGQMVEHVQRLDWVVAGGESGPGARPMQAEWARSLRDQCAAAGVPFFFKQWGAWLPSGQHQAVLDRPWIGDGRPLLTTKANAGRLLDGQLHDAMPQ